MKKAFTVIELSVVIAVLAILAGAVTANVAYFMRRARDARRLSDMSVIGLALESFYYDQGRYPDAANDGFATPERFAAGSESEKVLRSYVRGGVPRDPLYVDEDSEFYYAYYHSHPVDWCDGDPGTDTTSPILGFSRKETDTISLNTDTCTGDFGADPVGASVYNIAFSEL